jgi:hypothetical protein
MRETPKIDQVLIDEMKVQEEKRLELLKIQYEEDLKLA